MSAPGDWVIVLMLLAGAAVLVVVGVRGLQVTRAILSRRTTPIGAITAGPIEVEGVVHASTTVHRAADNLDCVAVYKVSVTPQAPRQPHVTERVYIHDAPAELRDASGVCDLDLESVELLGDVWSHRWRDPVHGGHGMATHTVVPVGARVLVLGDAAPSGLTGGDGNRDGRPRFTVRASPGRGVIVSTSGHTGTLWKTAWPALVTLACAVLCAVLSLAFALASSGLASRIG